MLKEEKKFSISVDMGAKNNGVFIAKTKGYEILDKKAFLIKFDTINSKKGPIKFSKEDRRENRHKVRNYKRRKLAKRLLQEFVDFSKYNDKQKESILGLLNNRGFTYLDGGSEFKQLNEESLNFIKKNIKDFPDISRQEEFTEYTEELLNSKDEKNSKFEEILELKGELEIYECSKHILADLSKIKEKPIKNKSNIIKIFDKCQLSCKDSKEKVLNLSSMNKDKFIEILNDKNIKIMNNKDIQIKDLYKYFLKEIDVINKKFSKFFNDKEEEKKNILAKILYDLKALIKFLNNMKKELETGSKPRSKYFEEIEKEIKKDFDFIKDFEKKEFFRLVANISNLQLRVLRKYFNKKFDDKLDLVKLDRKIRGYFKVFHYKTEDEKKRKKDLFSKGLEKDTNDIEKFFKCTDPLLTIPPYEDMNNRDTYKCNSMLINPEFINDKLKKTIDYLLSREEFEILNLNEEGVFIKEELKKISITSNNKKEGKDFTYSKYLQRILDISSKNIEKNLNPRNVFKVKLKSSIEDFKKSFGSEHYEELRELSEKYYKEEEKIYSGIYEQSNSIFVKCNTNTPYKNNIKHRLLKPIYSYDFKKNEADKFIKAIKSERGLETALKRVSQKAKEYQNSFYHIIEDCFNSNNKDKVLKGTSKNNKCVDDKDIKLIVSNINKNFLDLKETLENELEIKNSYFSKVSSDDKVFVKEENLRRVVNILKQTYEILFENLDGFNKTCKDCTIENGIRSAEVKPLGKRLLSDVAKPIDGMLDMVLDRIAYEIVENISKEDIQDIDSLEILLEQNKFNFEENLNSIKGKKKNNKKDKDAENISKEDNQDIDSSEKGKGKNNKKYKDALNISKCPYNGKNIGKGDFDHILPQSKGVYNSKANMIYSSVEGNQAKGDKEYTLKDLNKEHLKVVFGTEDLNYIKDFIKKHIEEIDEKEFSNFNNLNLSQQKAFRYALFMRSTEEFKKALNLLKKDKIKTFSNGTQKRLARFIYKKLINKFPNIFKDIEVHSKTIDSQLVRARRNFLARTDSAPKKEEIQDAHSHCIDAMVVFYLANEKAFKSFKEIYEKEFVIKNVSKRKRFIDASQKELASYKLFDDTIYSEHYKHIKKEEIKKEDLETLIKHSLLYKKEKLKKEKLKKIYIKNLDEIKENLVHKIDVLKTSNIIYKLFNTKNKEELKKLKFLDNYRYCTSRKEIADIFFNKDVLKDYTKINGIPETSKNLYKAVYKKLEKAKEKDKDKIKPNSEDLTKLLASSVFPTQENKERRKRGKKRHKFTLPMIGSPKFRIKRGDTWQVLGNKYIATKFYIVNEKLKPISFFSKNLIPLEIKDILDTFLIEDPSKNIVDIKFITIPQELNEAIKELDYRLSEGNRVTITVKLKKAFFKGIDFSKISSFNYKDNKFKKFVDEYLNLKPANTLQDYIGGIRNDKKDAKASLISSTDSFIELRYIASSKTSLINKIGIADSSIELIYQAQKK